MKNDFRGDWSSISYKSINEICDLILTGKTIQEMKSDEWLFPYIGSEHEAIKVLDFGCGIGRNTFDLAYKRLNWNVFGYDSESMLSRTNDYYKNHYSDRKFPNNLTFSSDWNFIKEQHFDVIMCCIVLQHIHEDVIINYLNDFKKITKKVVVHGRRFNDEIVNGEYKNTWQILENNGFYPSNAKEINYNINGDVNEHVTCIYEL